MTVWCAGLHSGTLPTVRNSHFTIFHFSVVCRPTVWHTSYSTKLTFYDILFQCGVPAYILAHFLQYETHILYFISVWCAGLHSGTLPTVRNSHFIFYFSVVCRPTFWHTSYGTKLTFYDILFQCGEPTYILAHFLQYETHILYFISVWCADLHSGTLPTVRNSHFMIFYFSVVCRPTFWHTSYGTKLTFYDILFQCGVPAYILAHFLRYETHIL
jgi:hypothetical protein